MTFLDQQENQRVACPDHTKLVFWVKSADTRLVLDNDANHLYHIGMNELRRFREAAGLSQTELAEKIDSQQSQISRWEKNEREIPFDWAFKFGIFFDCHPGKFRPELLTDELDVLLVEHPEIKREVRQFAEYLLRKSGV